MGRGQKGEECEELFVKVVSGHVRASGNSGSGGPGRGVLRVRLEDGRDHRPGGGRGTVPVLPL